MPEYCVDTVLVRGSNLGAVVHIITKYYEKGALTQTHYFSYQSLTIFIDVIPRIGPCPYGSGPRKLNASCSIWIWLLVVTRIEANVFGRETVTFYLYFSNFLVISQRIQLLKSETSNRILFFELRR